MKLLLARNRHLYRWSVFALNVIRFALRRPHDPDFAAFAKFGERSGIFLDVGANTGQSALAFRIFNRSMEIVSIEPNRLLERELRLVGRLLSRFSYVIAGAGDADGSATLYVPVFRGLPLTGEASLEPPEGEVRSWWVHETMGAESADELELVEVPITIRRLDELALEPAFVKIDVEGAEPRVLRGMTDTIERHRPIFLIEDGGSHDEVAAFFAAQRYAPYEYVVSEGKLEPPLDRSARNLFYVPAEESVA